MMEMEMEWTVAQDLDLLVIGGPGDLTISLPFPSRVEVTALEPEIIGEMSTTSTRYTDTTPGSTSTIEVITVQAGGQRQDRLHMGAAIWPLPAEFSDLLTAVLRGLRAAPPA